MKTLRQLLQQNAVSGIETDEPELHNLCLEAGYSGIADMVRKKPHFQDMAVESVKNQLIEYINGT